MPKKGKPKKGAKKKAKRIVKKARRPVRKPKFEVYKDHAGKFRWRLRAANEEEIASGQGYESKESCMKGIESVMNNAAAAKVIDMTMESPSPEPVPTETPAPSTSEWTSESSEASQTPS